MHLILILVFLAAQYWFRAKQVEDKAVFLADDLSHDNPPQFIYQVPQAEYNKPSQVSLALLHLLSYDHYI